MTPNLHCMHDSPLESPNKKVKPDSWGSDLGLSACLIQQVKRGADHLGFINTQVAKSLVVPFWRPSPVTRTANNAYYDCNVGFKPRLWEHLKSAHTWGPLWRCVWAWSSQSHRARGGTVTPAPPPSLLPCVGCRHVRRRHTQARRSLCTGLCAMIWGGGGTKTEKSSGCSQACGNVRTGLQIIFVFIIN